MSITRKRFITITAFAVCAALLALTLTYPYNEDCVLYSYITWLMLHGRAPLVGSWAHNFPGIVLLLSPELLLLGRSAIAFHMFDVLIQCASLFLLYRVASRYDWRAALLAITFISTYYLQQGFTFAGQIDVFVTFAMMIAVYLVTERRNTWAFLCTALLCGWTITVRPTYFLFPVVFAFWTARSEPSNVLWKRAFAFLTVSAIPMIVLWLLYVFTGHFQEIWEGVILYNLDIYSVRGETFTFWWPIHYYYFHIVGLIAAFLLVPRDRRPQLWLFCSLALAAIASVLMTRKYAFYQYHPAMVMVFAIAAWGWVLAIDRIITLLKAQSSVVRTSIQSAGYALLIVYSLSLTFRGNTITHAMQGIAAGKAKTLNDVYTYYDSDPSLNRTVLESVAEYIRTHSSDTDNVQLLGQFLYPQFAAGRVSASRFININGLVTQPTDTSALPFQHRWREEFEEAILERPPALILLSNVPMTLSSSGVRYMVSDLVARDFPRIHPLLEQRYTPDTVIGAFTCYRRLR